MKPSQIVISIVGIAIIIAAISIYWPTSQIHDSTLSIPGAPNLPAAHRHQPIAPTPQTRNVCVTPGASLHSSAHSCKYTNQQFHFAITYPRDWLLEDMDPAYVTISSSTLPSAFLSIATIDVARENVFSSKTAPIYSLLFHGRRALAAACPSQSSFKQCSPDLAYTYSLRLKDLPPAWGQDNEIDYTIPTGAAGVKRIFDAILMSMEFQQ